MTQAEIVLCSPVRSAIGTYGNAPGLNSGAAAVIVAERRFAEKHGLQPWGDWCPMALRPSSRACSALGQCRPSDSELVGLKVSNIAWEQEGLVITLAGSKTDQLGQGITKAIPFEGMGINSHVKEISQELMLLEFERHRFTIGNPTATGR